MTFLNALNGNVQKNKGLFLTYILVKDISLEYIKSAMPPSTKLLLIGDFMNKTLNR